MNRATHERPPMEARPLAGLTACVVDPRAEDYAPWQENAAVHALSLFVVGSAEEALRLARAQRVDFWVINAALPGFSGADLCSMVKSKYPHAAVGLVCDHYSTEAERAAWAARATLFGCKGAHHDWLDRWLQRARPAPRIGCTRSNP